MKVASDCRLTYCSNIHPGETWPEIRDVVARYLPQVKERVCPDQALGVGLRVSGQAAYALEEPQAREELKALLAREHLYVFTINGFPYGTFHGARVKEEVYLPDWKDEERVRYTNTLSDLLAELLPDEPGLQGSISTVPGAFKPNAGTPEAVERMAEMMLRHAAHLVAVRERTGKTITLALEPEPYCFLETVGESVRFFRDHLHGSAAERRLCELTGLLSTEARAALRRHLSLCLDLCHAAVEFEDPDNMLETLREHEIEVGKLQITSGLRVPAVSGATRALLEPFNDRVYLHQVVERGAGELKRFVDLPEAFESLTDNGAGGGDGDGEREWRIHFHVPLFLDDFGAFSSTQSFVREVLGRHRAEPISRHLEVETYTWDVLPEQYRNLDVVDAVTRELEWVTAQLNPLTS